MLNQPTSSPMMTRMLGGLALLACACKVALPPAKKLETASVPSASFRILAPKSIVTLSLKVILGWPPPREGCDEVDPHDQPTEDIHPRYIKGWLSGKTPD